MTMNLSNWEQAQSEQIGELRAGADQSMLVRLLETSCLLELSKLSPTKLDLAGFVTNIVEVISQFFPIEGCSVRLEAPGIPTMRSEFGRIDHEAARELWEQLASSRSSMASLPGVRAVRIVDGQDGVAMLAMWHRSDGIDPEAFLLGAGDQLSSALSDAADAERLRRRSAGDNALRLAATFDEQSTDDHLDSLVSAVAGLPGATGASLRFEPDRHTPAMMFISGLLDGPSMLRREREFDRDGQLRLVVTWSTPPRPADEEQLDAILDTLVVALERAGRNRRLLEEAETDPLTGLANRRRASRALAAALNRSERSGEPLTVAAVDLDHFKQVNDELGHDVGDVILQTVAGALQQEGRSYDVCARLGGDEFMVILPGADLLGARSFAERVIALIEQECADHLPDRVSVTASVGLASFPDHADTGEQLQRCADEAMYSAKRGGRNQVVDYSPT